ncbi:hypothetical protein R3P38DRAFT_2771511 [Favolaschia claudopus]|uniref:Uncharacterized protein n=1 Tax=Favolaschia claudopus TaxID=2862362 RepID=A0AAW0CCM3_9AGAR
MHRYLAPNARINPTHFRSVLKGHDKNFLGNVVFGEDMFAPKPPNYFYTARAVDAWNDVLPQDKFQTILFGRVGSLPVVTEVGTFITLKHPDWASAGYGKDEFKNLFYGQMEALSASTEVDMAEDYDADQHLNIRDWTHYGDLKVDIWKWYQTTLFSKSDARGVFTNSVASHNGDTFPFKLGDTVIVDAELYRVVVDHEDAPTYRGYHIFAHHMKEIRPLHASHEHGMHCDCNEQRESRATEEARGEDEGDGEADMDMSDGEGDANGARIVDDEDVALSDSSTLHSP